ncbi:MAG: conjugal transfer protein TraF [Pontiellaceae bacterium]|nr:conjugal transfer protein TraF [Pontiellaceae bacterium]MBN2784638.1 conjugal transfer protein TraF [Pontiellaceae bacterium]
MKRYVVVCLGAGALFVLQNMSKAEEFGLAGGRAAAMGGANAASVRDASAQLLNPAAFGFFGREEWQSNAVDNANLSTQGFSWDFVGVGAGITLTEDMGRYLDVLADIDFDAFDAGSLSSNPDNLKNLLSMGGILGGLDASDALYADVSAGTSIQVGRFGVGLHLFGEAAAWALPDTANLALDDYAVVGDLVTEINTAASNDGFVWDGSYQLTAQQRSDLATALGGIAADSDTIKYLDDQFGGLAADGSLTSTEVAEAIGLFSSFIPGSGGSIDDNLTTVVGRGFALVEVPVSYGWAINENLAIGATAKLMYGSVLGTKVWIFDDENDQVLEEVSDAAESTMNFGIDLGVMYRLPNFQFALVGHNLNRPTFDGFTDTIDYTVNGGATQTETISVPDVEVDPQVTLGAAFMPSRRLTLEGNLDLLETGTLLPGYDIQRVSFGGEIDVWLIALRAGAYRNLAASWQDWVATAGVGVNLLGLKVDVGGAYALGDSVEFDGNDVPSEARLFASVAMDF